MSKLLLLALSITTMQTTSGVAVQSTTPHDLSTKRELVAEAPESFKNFKIDLSSIKTDLTKNGESTKSKHAEAETSRETTESGVSTKEVREFWVTAYSSTPDQTDDTPFTTASGKTVRDGIVATNMLPFGTKVKIPDHFGDKVFVVEDRMHSRKVGYLDVWMSSRENALHFGINYAKVVVLN